MRPQLFSGILILLIISRFLFHTEMYNNLWVAIRLIDAFIIYLSVSCCYKLTKLILHNRHPMTIVSLVGLLFVGVISYGTNFTTDLGDKLRFNRYKKEYVEIIDKIKLNEISAKGKFEGVNYDSETNKVTRVSFSWGGIIDNWKGIVYDPTNELSKIAENNGIHINYIKGKSLTPAEKQHIKETTELKIIFGGVIYKVTKMRDNWYLCWFT